jgi:hypothetical protein
MLRDSKVTLEKCWQLYEVNGVIMHGKERLTVVHTGSEDYSFTLLFTKQNQ